VPDVVQGLLGPPPAICYYCPITLTLCVYLERPSVLRIVFQTMYHYASAVYATAFPSVCLYVCHMLALYQNG